MFQLDHAVMYTPSGINYSNALEKTTHLAVGAHQDDLEIMAIEGILACYDDPDLSFSGVIVNDGAGAPRAGAFADYTNEQMAAARIDEQKNAADIGQYESVALLGYSTDEVKDRADSRIVSDLSAVLKFAQPEIIYTHNLLDKHDAHVAVALKTIEAIRKSPMEYRPQRLLGCEVWRDLDWLVGEDKVVMDSTTHHTLQEALLKVFESQVAGGKRYDLAAMGRRCAHATYLEPHQVDEVKGAVFGIDLTPLIQDDSMNVEEYAMAFVDRLKDDCAERFKRLR